ncbi:hypothetical protein [Terrabacter aeriphilus]|uniref:hypothetical protein n=1 Tax=Terrabacter aeriphilus TaxID=515662 RepID=UPI0031ECD610
MSDSGFVDEAEAGRGHRSRPRPVPSGVARDAPDGRAPEPRARRRRRRAVLAAFALVVVGLVGFGGWAWAGRVHADDLAAYTSLAHQVEELDRTMTPLGHGEVPPCREATDGSVTRTYPPSTGPQAAELVGFLLQKGWRQSSGAAPAPVVAHLSRDVAGHELTIDVSAASMNQLVEALTARSPASAFGCLGR